MGKMPPALAAYHANKAKKGKKSGKGKPFGGKKAPPFGKKGK